MAKKPKPFKRPSIEVSPSGSKRGWARVSPDKLSEGDTLADFGRVQKVVVRRRPQSHATMVVDDIESGLQPIDSIEVVGVEGNFKIFQPTDVCFAFTFGG